VKNAKSKYGFMCLALTASLLGCSGGNDSNNIVVSETCSLDSIVGATGVVPVFTASADSTVEFQGWLADAMNSKTPKEVKIELINLNNQVQLSEIGSTGIRRDDVAAALKSPHVQNAGFSVKAKLTGMPVGEYGILLVGAYEKQVAACNTSRKLIIK
jgi:hypothetical protein